MDRPAPIAPKVSVVSLVKDLKSWTNDELPYEKYPLCDTKSVTEFFTRNLVDFQKVDTMKTGTYLDLNAIFRYDFFIKMKNFKKLDLIFLCTYNSIYSEGQNITRDDDTITDCLRNFDGKMIKLMAPRILDFCALWGPQYDIFDSYLVDVIDHPYFKTAYHLESIVSHPWDCWAGMFDYTPLSELPEDLLIFLKLHPKFFLCVFSIGPDNKDMKKKFPKIYPVFRIMFDKYYKLDVDEE